MLVLVSWRGKVSFWRAKRATNFICLADGMDMWEITRLAMLMVKGTVDRE